MNVKIIIKQVNEGMSRLMTDLTEMEPMRMIIPKKTFAATTHINTSSS